MFFVMTPTRDFGRFVGDAVQSVRDQGIPGLHHHIQDAMSTDDTADVVASRSWPGLVHRVEPDRGLSDALNRALAACPPEASFIGWLNADEFYLPGALDAVTRVFAKHPEAEVVYGDSIHVDQDGRVLRLVAQHRFSPTVLWSMRHLYIQSGSVFFRRSLLDRGLLSFSEDYKQAMDHEMFLRLARAGVRFHYVPKAISCFRVHGAQLSQTNGAHVASRDFAALAADFGHRPQPWKGRAAHRARKIAEGAYLRELKTRQRRGTSLRWFDDQRATS